MNKLKRNPDKGYIGGVCQGIGEHTNTDPIIWRIAAIVSAPILIYVLFWIFLKKT